MVSSKIIKSWFAQSYQQMSGAVQGCVCFGEANAEHYDCIATSSDSYTVSELVQENISAVLKRRKSVVTRIGSVTATQSGVQQVATSNVKSSGSINSQRVTAIDSKNFLVTCPILLNRQLYGVVVIEFKHDPAQQHQDYLQQVETAVNWLKFLSLIETGEVTTPEVNQKAGLALQITALSMAYDTSQEAAAAVATELATKLSCERVSICYLENNDIKLYALSHSVRYESKQNLIKCIEAAVEEAVIQKETLVYPVTDSNPYMLQAHINLIKISGCHSMCTVPLVLNERVVGGILFERVASATVFDGETVELCEQLASLFAPVLEFRRQNDRPFNIKVKESLKSAALGLLGRSHLGMKLGAIIAAMIFSLLFFMQWDYRVSANTVLEGSIERVITAPEEGFIKNAVARPGDIVDAGQMLVTLDDRDLELEKLKWSGKQKQIAKEYREALASRNKSQVGILRARRDQALAQIEILDKKLERTVIKAPISGVVVSGDFTQSLGSPVERGQILYSISPLDQYRVLLDIDESDIAEIQIGMKGELTLSAEADATYEIVIEKITPVSTPGDGVNYFKVEASLVATPEFLRPGMQGVSKVMIGDRQLLWIWTHKMVDWLRLQIWVWY